MCEEMQDQETGQPQRGPKGKARPGKECQRANQKGPEAKHMVPSIRV